jgi:hypothetical protein
MTPMVSPRLHEAFEISFHGTRVQSLHLVEVDIKNVGNAPIRSADYRRLLGWCVGKAQYVVPRSSRGDRPTSILLWPSSLPKSASRRFC